MTNRPRRGAALVDVLVGGVILSIGLGIAMSVASRSLASQTDGEKQMVAAWLADELLAMVVMEGPVAYPQLHDTAGRFDAPFDEYTFDVGIDDQGIGLPFRVTAHVRWDGRGDGVQIETLIAQRQGDPIEIREPFEPVDREGRYLEYDQQDS